MLTSMKLPPLLSLSLLLLAPGLIFAQEDARPPNVVFILTDNHGAWTLGCYGNPDIKTPHIDKMAAEGVRFTNAFCNNAVCSPTRATYLTGLMPSQHGVHNFLGGGRLQTGPDARNTLAEFRSLPEILTEAGYKCGLVGKWHLGANESPQESLDDYWITMPHGGTSTFHNAKIIENGEIRTEEEHLTTFWTKHALRFIDEQKSDPFFLFLSYNGPYGLSRFQIEPLRGPRAHDYADAEMKSFPGGVIHPWEYNNREYFGNITAQRRYAAELSAVDDGVGAVLGKLKALGLDENTLVVFAADQGWAGGQHGFWGMGDHTRPLNAFEYSMRIPLIFRHPGGIKSGQTPGIFTSNYDFLPSVLGYLGLSDKMAKKPLSPGRDYSPVLRGEKIADWKDEVFYEYENLRCIRTRDWKYIQRYEDSYNELYHLAEDPDELTNLIETKPDVLPQLQERLDQFFAKNTLPKYDLWNGGKSQPRTILWGRDSAQLRANFARRGIMPTTFDLSWNPPEFELPPGYIAEVVAARPIIEHPMMATFDDRGRLFVAEAAGVNLKKEELAAQLPNRIRLLEDTNNDGIFDKSTIFADDMTFPQGALWLNGALYVASPPGIWMLLDTDEDGVADYRAQLAGGFDYTGNAADVHGPFLHPSGRIFWCHGRKGHKVYQRDGKTLVSEAKGARIWSMLPDGSDIRVHAGGGMDNPVEIDFTPEGEIIGSINLFYGRPRGDVLVHWLYGGRYPRLDQGAVLEEFAKTGPILREAHNFGHVAVSGMTIERNAAKPGEISVLTAMFNTQHIERTTLRWEGATLTSKMSESWLKIRDPDVHLTDVLEDADGSVLVVDTGGWFRIGCPTSQLAKPEIPGAIYRIRKAGVRDRATDFRGAKLDWSNASNEQLSARLADERLPVQERAIREFALRGDEALDTLDAALSAKNEVVRRNAVWALTRIHSPDAHALIRQAVEDKSPSVAHAACNSVVATGDPGAVEFLATPLTSPDPNLRRAAATALGRTGNAAAIPHLTKLLSQPIDRATRHAAIFALIEIGDYDKTAFESPVDGEGLSGVLWALDQMRSSKLTMNDLAGFLRDAGTNEAALEIAAGHPEWAPDFAGYFAKFAKTSGDEAWRDQLAVLGPKMLGDPAMQAFFGDLLANSGQREFAFGVIADAPGRMTMPESWIAPFRASLGENAALRAAAKLQPGPLRADLEKVAANADLPERRRFLALRALARDAKLSDEGFSLLTHLLSPKSTPAERAEAVALLGEFRLTKPQLLALAKLLPQASAIDFRGILAAFNRTRDGEVGQAIARGISTAPAAANVAPMELRRLINRFPDEARQIAETRITELESGAKQRQLKLEQLASRVAKEGDAVRGSQVFTAGLGACITCHKIGETGFDVGPDLTQIGRIRTARDLLESILFPGASIARDFEAFSVKTRAGQVHTGLVRSESEDALTLVLAGGAETRISRAEVASMTPAPVSFMPLGLENAMTEAQLLDLVAFLDQLEEAR